ncbi:MAG: hypothetical protein A4E53_01260 [Pelotomaculum sp. PtaB.Bin104]|nr:MAG: hypothetical protein A4E53_01260 [Pelotomaculum sp. PtaB.Bin104]
MVGYLNDLEKIFFTWCDYIVQCHIDHEGITLKRWRPRKNPDGSYDLVFELAAHGETAAMYSVSVPEAFHELLEREHLINPPKRKHGGLVLIVDNSKKK